MKGLGNVVFSARSGGEQLAPRRAYERINAREEGLPESWFRDAIHADPELIVSPCRQAGRVAADEVWLPWGVEVAVDAGPIDVLLVSSRGRVAIVETKLSYNPEGRRTVVAQALDYALALQETTLEDLPDLPAGELSPVPADVEECLQAGRFLLVIAGDVLDPRALRLSQGLLGRHLTAEWDLAMVDLNLFRPLGNTDEFLVIPELRGVVLSEVRQVVRVTVQGETAGARVEVEHVVVDEPTSRQRQKLSPETFLERVGVQAPALVTDARAVLEKFREVERRSNGSITVELQSSTANLYLDTPEGRKRFIGLNTEGRFRVIPRYLDGAGREELAARVREGATPLMNIPPDRKSDAVWLGEVEVEQVCAAIDRVVEGLLTSEVAPT